MVPAYSGAIEPVRDTQVRVGLFVDDETEVIEFAIGVFKGASLQPLLLIDIEQCLERGALPLDPLLDALEVQVTRGTLRIVVDDPTVSGDRGEKRVSFDPDHVRFELSCSGFYGEGQLELAKASGPFVTDPFDIAVMRGEVDLDDPDFNEKDLGASF